MKENVAKLVGMGDEARIVCDTDFEEGITISNTPVEITVQGEVSRGIALLSPELAQRGISMIPTIIFQGKISQGKVFKIYLYTTLFRQVISIRKGSDMGMVYFM